MELTRTMSTFSWVFEKEILSHICGVVNVLGTHDRTNPAIVSRVSKIDLHPSWNDSGSFSQVYGASDSAVPLKDQQKESLILLTYIDSHPDRFGYIQ